MRLPVALTALLLASPALAQPVPPPTATHVPVPPPAPPTPPEAAVPPPPAPVYAAHKVDLTAEIFDFSHKPIPDPAEAVRVPGEPGDPRANPPKPPTPDSMDCSKCRPLVLARVLEVIACTQTNADRPAPTMIPSEATALTVRFWMRCAHMLAIGDPAFITPTPPSAHDVTLSSEDIGEILSRARKVGLTDLVLARFVPMITGETP